ncbi:MAG: transposase [Actinomycetota bacterium]
MDGVDWTHGAEHMRARHGVEVDWANEALRDPDALRIDPDPSSKSGRSVRTVGNSATAGSLLTVITVTEEGTTYGVNGWKSNATDIKRYREEAP